MASHNMLPILDLNTGNPSENWEQWLNRFKIYLLATEVNKKSEEIQIAQLLHFAGSEVIKIYNTFKFSEDEKNKLSAVIDKLNSHFKPRENVHFLRYKFFQSKQNGRTTEQFVTDLRKQASSCKFNELTDELILSVLISGTNSSSSREKLLQDDNLTLEKAVKLCAILEQSKAETLEIVNKEERIDVVRTRRRQDTRQRAEYKSRSSSRSGKYRSSSRTNQFGKSKSFINDCTRCGSNHPINKCLAYGKQCTACLKMNHFSAKCKSRVDSVENITDTVDSLFIGSVEKVATEVDTVVRTWRINVGISGKDFLLKVDTGAVVNLLSSEDFLVTLKLPRHLIKSTNRMFKSYTGDLLPIIGLCVLDVSFNNSVYEMEFYVVNGKSEAILGLPSCIDLKLVKQSHDSNNNCHKFRIDRVSNDEINQLIKEYPDIFSGIGCIGTPYHINVFPDAKPVVSAIRNVPFALQNKLKVTLDNLEKNKIIEKVNGPTEWLNPLVLVKKKDGALRICLDPLHLNKVIMREHCKLRTFEEITSHMSGACYFSKLDCSQAYFQVPLDESSAKLCAFGTIFGRYKFNRLPYGIKVAPEVFDERFRNIFNITNVNSYVDDLIIWGHTKKEHDDALRKVFQVARQHNVKFNLSKCEFAQKQVCFMGHVISEKGVALNPDRLEAILKMKDPTSKKDVQILLGVVNYVNKYVPNFAIESHPLRELLKKDVVFTWGETEINALNKIKKKLTESPVLQFYNPNKEITVSVDSSSTGLGACLLQEKLPVCYASKSLTETQTHYAQIEKEMLAVLFGLNKFHDYVYGRHVTVETDHKPLIHIVSKTMDKCPARLQRILLQLQKYQFTLKYTPGKELIIADALSRTHFSQGEVNDPDVTEQVCVINPENISNDYLQKIKVETEKDVVLKKLYQIIKVGWPNSLKHVNESNKIYYKYKGQLTISNGIIYKENACVIPKCLRNEILHKIHYNHLGFTKCMKLAREVVFWPTLNNELKQLIENCMICQKYSNSQPSEPLCSHDVPLVPWHKLGCDLFHLNGQNYLIVVDYYSKFIEVAKLNNNTTSKNIIENLKSMFARFGVPKVLISDGGPQFTGDAFRNFAQEWDFKHNVTSPYNSQSNGLAERNVQTVKKMFKKLAEENKDIYLGLLQLRNVPIFENVSPAEILMSRNTRNPFTHFDIKKLKTHLIPKSKYNAHIKSSQVKQATYYNKKKGVSDLSDLPVDSNVLVQLQPNDTWQMAKVVKKITSRRYKVKLEKNDRFYVRNRKFIKPTVLKNVNMQKPLQDKKITWADNHTETQFVTLGQLNNLLNVTDVTREPDESKVIADTDRSNAMISAQVSTSNSCTSSNITKNCKNKTERGRTVRPPNRLNL